MQPAAKFFVPGTPFMLRNIQNFFNTRIQRPEGVTSREATEDSLRIATAALLIEAARADHELKEEERKAVDAALQKSFGLGPEEIEELYSLAEQEVKESAGLYQFTRLINKGFSYEKKRGIVELLWQVVFADSELEKHEEHLVRKVAELLHVSHKDFIEAKISARERSGG